MRRPLTVLLAAITLHSGLAGAQNTEATKRRIAALEERWIQAVIQRDGAAFTNLLHPRFTYTEDDRIYSRAALIREVTTGADTVTAGENVDLKVEVFGTTAIATGWLVLRGRSGGRPFERRYRYTDTWQRVDGAWRVIAAQDCLKP
jgi:ketosteroid isomerase-like protein